MLAIGESTSTWAKDPHRKRIVGLLKANGFRYMDDLAVKGDESGSSTWKRDKDHPAYGTADGATLVMVHGKGWAWHIERIA